MSINSQNPILRHNGRDPSRAEPITGVARRYQGGEVVDWHFHEHGQLLHAIEGLMKIETPAGVWVVPPERAVFVPTGTAHKVTQLGEVEWRSLNLLEGLEGLPESCQVIEVGPLLRELIIEIHKEWQGDKRTLRLRRLTAVLIDQLRDMKEQALGLPLPSERRLKPIVDALLADPSDVRSLEEFAKVSPASARTLARLFEPVTSVAFAVGYDSPSAFIAMFREAMGQSPGKYLRTAGSLAAGESAV